MTNIDANNPAEVFDGVPFDEFYDRALPVVYGYLLRLCGGDADEAWDLTQDSWIVVLDRLADGQAAKATIGYLLSVARSRAISMRGAGDSGCSASCGWCGRRPVTLNRRSCRRPSCSSTSRRVPPSIGWC